MRVISCCKAVPEEQDIVVAKDRQISFEKAEWKFGQYDLNAVEAGKQLVEAAGGQLSGLCAGGNILDNSKMKKDILSRGLDDLYLVIDESLEQADTYQSARVLEAAIKKIGDFDLVLCGAGSSDLYAQQVGNQLGELLGIPVVNAVNRIMPQGDKVIVERALENEIQVLEITLPAVLSVTSEINVPRIPGMKDIIAANKKPVTKFTLSEIEVTNSLPSSTVLSTLAPEQAERRLTILEGESEDIVDAFVKLLRAELK
ncbi:MAG: electron transfer flavoprotein [Peptococcaceae bacterium]|nr:electron transfer flavoprotein [Peptococcaceae bacterium]